ncbi:MAG: hypothetical protein JOZ14_10610 [Acidobacteria bacterium]|nr:hypothetical protein [Acidobacteriota bacterium]
MLKISSIDTQVERRVVLEGKLVGPWVAELRKYWETAARGIEIPIVVDLRNVTFISQEGEDLLSLLMNEGAKFSCQGVLTKYLLKRLERQCGRNKYS